MRIRIKYNSLIVLTYILSGLMVAGQFFGVSAITSIAFALSFMTVLLLWCLKIKDLQVLDLLALLIVVLSFACAFATYTSLSIGYFINWITFAFVFLFFSVCMKVKLDRSTLDKLFKINFIVGMLSAVAYVVRFDQVFYITNTGMKYLCYDFYNPNSAAIFLFCIAITGMLKYFFSDRSSLMKQILYIGLFFALILQTLSRTALIAMLFFLLIYVIFKRKDRYFLPRGVLFCLIISIIPLLFVLVYKILLNNASSNEALQFLVSEGKELDSRQYVWEYAFRLFRESPIFGSYGQLMSGASFSQMHNSHLNVLVSYGAIVFVLVVIFLFLVMRKITATSQKNHSELAVWAFIVCLILGCGEAILFSGGLSFYLFVGQFLLLSNVSDHNMKILNHRVLTDA